MTKKLMTLSHYLSVDGNRPIDVAKLVGKDRRQVHDAIKRDHLLIRNSKGEHFLVPQLYKGAFE